MRNEGAQINSIENGRKAKKNHFEFERPKYVKQNPNRFVNDEPTFKTKANEKRKKKYRLKS